MSQIGPRAAMLDGLRRRLARPRVDHSLRPVERISGTPPEIGYDVELGDLVEAFGLALAAAGGVARSVSGTDPADLRDLIGDLVAVESVRTAAVTGEPECRGVAEMLRALGVVVVDPADRAAVADADLGVTGAFAGIALTGTVVLSSERAGGRLVSLLPRTHLALVRREVLVPTPGALLRQLEVWQPDGLPANLVLVTGPSRSADIELQITLGVHGPRAVWVGLLDGPP